MNNEIEKEVYNTFKELQKKYGIIPKYTFGVIHSDKPILALYTPELDLILFDKKWLSYFWNKNSDLAKKLLKAVVYHEYYHYLRGHGYTVIADKVIKVYYTKVLMQLARFTPFRIWEELNAMKFEYKSGVSPFESRKIASILASL